MLLQTRNPFTIKGFRCFKLVRFQSKMGVVSAADKGVNMNEIFFIVEDAPEGGYTAKALGESIYTDADNLEELHANVQDAVRCHFHEDKKPKMIRLHFVCEVM
jgi:hypothetical protein